MTLIIAEAGVNHNGNEELAFQLIDEAFKAGADIVKFQTFKAKDLVTSKAQKAAYQVIGSSANESQLEMLSRLELSHETHHKLIAHCKQLGIEFMSTAFDSKSLDFLINDLGLTRLKIPSGEITNAPLVLEYARSKCDLIVSTGMATISEIWAALGVIAFGYTADLNAKPSVAAFSKALSSEAGLSVLKQKVSLLHCTTEYPAPLKEVNLRAMEHMATEFGLPIGYSDHTEGVTIAIAAVARGALIIEKHFTLDRAMEGPDHKSSLEPDELAIMVKSIRDTQCALGRYHKQPQPSELNNITAARKSLVAVKEILKGENFTSDNMSVMRPGNGVSPINYWALLNSVSANSYKVGDLIFE